MSEKSPIFSYLKNPTMIDYPRHLAGVFFISGCNFKCGFCHNAFLMGKPQEGMCWEDIDYLCKTFKDNWADAVVITGGEPTICPQLKDLIAFFKKYNFKIKLDTNGSMPNVLSDIIGDVDYIAMDIKCSMERYLEIPGFLDAENIMSSIQLLKNSNKNYEFRTTIIEHIHTKEEMIKISQIIKGSKKYVLQAFVPRENLPDKKLINVHKTSLEYLKVIRELIMGCADSIEIRC